LKIETKNRLLSAMREASSGRRLPHSQAFYKRQQFTSVPQNESASPDSDTAFEREIEEAVVKILENHTTPSDARVFPSYQEAE
jgi:hypothetical protein